jgi:hypothetical protein
MRAKNQSVPNSPTKKTGGAIWSTPLKSSIASITPILFVLSHGYYDGIKFVAIGACIFHLSCSVPNSPTNFHKIEKAQIHILDL